MATLIGFPKPFKSATAANLSSRSSVPK